MMIASLLHFRVVTQRSSPQYKMSAGHIQYFMMEDSNRDRFRRFVFIIVFLLQ